MLQKYRHVIWDWNGTLLDDAWLCVEILNEILRQRNEQPVTHERYKEEFGFPVKDFYQRLGFDFSVESFEALADEYISKYDERRFECKLHAHATDVVRHCLDRGVKQSILSAYHQVRLEEALDFFELRPLFSHVIGLDDFHANGKIHQGIRLIEELGFGPDEVLLIGDTIHDYEVAREVGADCTLFVGGHNTRERLASCGVPVFDSLEQLSFE